MWSHETFIWNRGSHRSRLVMRFREDTRIGIDAPIHTNSGVSLNSIFFWASMIVATVWLFASGYTYVHRRRLEKRRATRSADTE